MHKSWDIYFRTNAVQSPPTLGQSSSVSAQQTNNGQLSPASLNQIMQLIDYGRRKF